MNARRQVELVCESPAHSGKSMTIGLLFPPNRPPLTVEQFDAYVAQWVDTLRWTHPTWPTHKVLAKAKELAQINELTETQVTYQSYREFRTNSGQRHRIESKGLVAEKSRNGGRTFHLSCTVCKKPKRVSADRMTEVLAKLDGDVLLFADL